MTDLTTVTTPRRLSTDRFEADVPDGWQQGRGAFGGLVVGLLARALLAFDEDEKTERKRSLRTLTVAICGPVLPGANALRVERLRTGTGVANVAARIERDGETLAHAVAVLGRDRAPGTSYRELAAPSMPSWRAMPEPARASFGPPFANFFEMWPLAPMPFTKAEHAMTSGWVRPREPGPVVDAATIATVIDAYWPATFTRFDAFRPMATIAYTLEILDDLHGLDPTAPLFYTARSPVAHGGYTSEERQLWTEDGRLLARNYQTFAIIT